MPLFTLTLSLYLLPEVAPCCAPGVYAATLRFARLPGAIIRHAAMLRLRYVTE